jgi:hypothetical protein
VNGGSGYFDGTGDYLVVPANSATDVSTGDFTLEAWVNFNALVNDVKIYIDITDSSNYWQFAYRTTTGMSLIISGNTAIVSEGSSSGWSTGSWYHVALVRSGNTFTIYRNGVATGSNTSSTSIGVFAARNVGGWTGSAASSINGYISNLRILKGTALYTTNFTPPTAPLAAVTNTSLLLNFTNAGIFDNTGKNVLETVGNAQVDTAVVKYGTGSMKFDGSGDSLSVPSNVENGIGTSDFSVEAWIYPTAAQGNRHITDSTSAGGLFLKTEATTVGIGRATIATDNMFSFTFSPNQWYHVAFCRQGSTVYGFVDGVQIGSGANTVNYTSPTGLTIGNAASGTAGWIGYIDDLRITKGIARYTANFTPPAKAFPNL